MRLFAPIRRHSRKAGRSAILLLAVSALAAPPAVAASQPSPAAPLQANSAAGAVAADNDAASSQVASPSNSNPAREEDSPNEDILARWTPERMAEAQPIDGVPDGNTVSSENGQAQSNQSSSQPSSSESTGATPVQGEEVPVDAEESADYPPAVGKLFFFTSDGDMGKCTASVLNSVSDSVILTAGHCLYNAENGTWNTGFMFSPGYDGRKPPALQNPVGIWTAEDENIFAPDEWVNGGDTEYDVGMVRLNRGGDTDDYINKVVGGNVLEWDGPSSFKPVIFGYPSNKEDPDGSIVMWQCSTEVSQRSYKLGPFKFYYGNYYFYGCNFGGGSSGSPLLDSYSSETKAGYVKSILRGGTDQDNIMNEAVYFGDWIKTLRDRADGVEDWM